MLDFAHLEQYRENNRIEAKKALGGLPKSIWETYSAFANTMGGIILLGVEEYKDHTLHPVNLPDPERMVREFWDKLNNPAITNINILTPKHIQIRNINGNDIIVITVPRATRQERPVYINKIPLNGTYRRNGEGDYKCTREEVLGMQRDALIISPDMKHLPHLGLEVFRHETVRHYRNRLKAYSPGHPWEGLTDADFLCELDAVELGEDNQMHPTVAGLLMFGLTTAITDELPNYHLEFRGMKETFSNTSCDNLCDFYFRVCDLFARHLTALPFGMKPGTMPYIHEALREALSNCLINADYYGIGGVQVTLSEDCFVFRNSGSFRINIEDARYGGISDPRNTALVRMFNLLDIGDSSGDGLSRIYDIWQQMGWDAPILREHFSPDTIELILRMRHHDGSKLSDTTHNFATSQSNRKLIISYLTGHAHASEAELTNFIGLSASDVQELLTDLIELGIVERKSPVLYRLKA